VLQTAVALSKSSDCDTVWLIGLNVGTGVVWCRKEFQKFGSPLLCTAIQFRKM